MQGASARTCSEGRGPGQDLWKVLASETYFQIQSHLEFLQFCKIALPADTKDQPSLGDVSSCTITWPRLALNLQSSCLSLDH